eukprot:jgi/Pico_ML_1/52038/g2810.t1
MQDRVSDDVASQQAAMSDVSELKERARRHGLHPSVRKSAWLKLTSHVQVPKETTNALCEADERCIRLDVKRSLGGFLKEEEMPAAQERLEQASRKAKPRPMSQTTTSTPQVSKGDPCKGNLRG